MLARLNAGVVGTDSVGVIIIEALARTGIGRLMQLDANSVETVNLDRLLHSTYTDASRLLTKRPTYQCRYAGDLFMLGDVAPPMTGRDHAAEHARPHRGEER